jgi:hypothetical protein
MLYDSNFQKDKLKKLKKIYLLQVYVQEDSRLRKCFNLNYILNKIPDINRVFINCYLTPNLFY